MSTQSPRDRAEAELSALLPETFPPTLLTLYWLASREVVQDLSDALDLRLSPRTEWTRVWA